MKLNTNFKKDLELLKQMSFDCGLKLLDEDKEIYKEQEKRTDRFLKLINDRLENGYYE